MNYTAVLSHLGLVLFMAFGVVDTFLFQPHATQTDEADGKECKLEAVHIWLDLYQINDMRLAGSRYEEDAFKGSSNIEFEDWIVLGKAIPDLESRLANFLESHKEAQIKDFNFLVSRDCLRFHKAILAMGAIGVSDQRSKYLLSLEESKNTRFFGFLGPLITAMGLISDAPSVEFLERFAADSKNNVYDRKLAVLAIQGELLEKCKTAFCLKEEEFEQRIQRLKAAHTRIQSNSAICLELQLEQR